jgi:hypothetical protein
MNYLEEIIVGFNKEHLDFSNKFTNLLKNVTEHNENKLFVKSSNELFLPRLSINNSSSEKNVIVTFLFNDASERKIIVENTTGLERKNSGKYSHIELNDVINRFDNCGLKILKIDHMGFNLPWFDNGIHPEILKLRNILSKRSF